MEKLQSLLTDTDEKLTHLPKPPSTDALSEVLHLVSTFSKALSKHLEGTPYADGLHQTVRPACNEFRRAIRATEPDFRPYDRKLASDNPSAHGFVAPSFISNEGIPYIPPDDGHSIFIDDVMKRAKE